jgi:hypothetical protein
MFFVAGQAPRAKCALSRMWNCVSRRGAPQQSSESRFVGHLLHPFSQFHNFKKRSLVSILMLSRFSIRPLPAIAENQACISTLQRMHIIFCNAMVHISKGFTIARA